MKNQEFCRNTYFEFGYKKSVIIQNIDVENSAHSNVYVHIFMLCVYACVCKREFWNNLKFYHFNLTSFYAILLPMGMLQAPHDDSLNEISFLFILETIKQIT